MSVKRFISLVLAAVAFAGLPAIAAAEVLFQCPTLPGGSFSDNNGDGIIRADDGEIVNPVKGSTQVCLHLAAGDGFSLMADGTPEYMFGFSNVTNIPVADVMNMWHHPTRPGGMLAGNFPAPLIKVKQGDDVYLSLTNVGMMMRPDLFDPHTVHWHGFPNAAAIFDGVPDASVSINMGSTLTYYYKVQEPGTFIYHCHVEATEHMQMGMLGNLYVTPAQDAGPPVGGFANFAYNDGDGSTGYNREYHLQIAAFDPAFHEASVSTQPLPFALMVDKYPMLNGRGYPDTVNPDPLVFSDPTGDYPMAAGHEGQKDSSLIVAAPDERILLRISSLATTSYHTLTVLGIPMEVVGRGARKLGEPNDPSQYYRTASVTLGGGESTDVILDTTGVAPGTYFLYTTNLDHLANDAEDYGGMMTEILVQAAIP